MLAKMKGPRHRRSWRSDIGRIESVLGWMVGVGEEFGSGRIFLVAELDAGSDGAGSWS